MFRRVLVALCLCGWSLSAWAAPPMAVIAGPEDPVEVGDLVELDSAASVGEGFLWLPMDVSSPPFRLYDSGRKLVFAAKRPGSVRFALIVSGSDGEAAGHVIVASEIVVIVSGDLPGPDPDPVPPVAPDRFGLRKAVTEWGSLVTGERAIARQMASNFRSIAALAKAGRLDVRDAAGKTDLISTLQAMNAAIGAANATLPASARPHWLPLVRNVNDRLTSLCDSKSGLIATVPDLAQAFEDIAGGLDTIKEAK